MTFDALVGGRPESLGELLEAYGRELHAVAYLILGDALAADDVVSESLITAFERGRSIRDGAALRAWLLRVATNKALSVRRRSARVVALHVLPDRAAEGDLATVAAVRVTLVQALDSLPPRTRAAVVLHYCADLPVDGVAAALGTSRNTVKTQLREGLERLRTMLAEPDPTTREVLRG